jgi:hypothetical protein
VLLGGIAVLSTAVAGEFRPRLLQVRIDDSIPARTTPHPAWRARLANWPLSGPSTSYGRARPTDEDIPDAQIYGATFFADFTLSTPSRTLTDNYYLLSVLFLALRRREMAAYRIDGDLRRISADFATFAPNWRGDAWLTYSRQDGIVDYEAPDGWNDLRRISATVLTPEGPGKAASVTVAEGRIRIPLAGGVPCRLTYR